jgi:hypothetical protein
MAEVMMGDFTFYQAEYDDMEQRLVIRKKGLWKL